MTSAAHPSTSPRMPVLQPVGIGVIGSGIMGRRMLAALGQHPGFAVAAVWDPQPDALAQGLALAPGAATAASLDALVALPAVQALYIASPPAAHLAGVQAAASLGKPVLCEKPLAANLAQAQALRDLVHTSALPLAVNFPFARSFAAGRLLQAQRSGALGTLQQATVTLRFAHWPRAWQAGAADWLAGPAQGGFTREVLSHFVFLALRLFGPAEVVVQRLDRQPGQTETALKAELHHAEATVVIDAELSGDIADHNRFELVGSAGRIALTDWYRLDHGGPLTERTDPSAGTLDGLAELIAGTPGHGLATVDEALAVVRCVEALLAG